MEHGLILFNSMPALRAFRFPATTMTMKKIFVVAALGSLLSVLPVRAHEGEEGGPKDHAEHFQKMKEEMLKHMDAEISMKQKMRDCISSASDPEGMKKCHEAG